MIQITGLTPWIMALGLALMAVLDAASVLIATTTMLTVGLLVGVRHDATIDGADTNRLEWLCKSLRPFVLRLPCLPG